MPCTHVEHSVRSGDVTLALIEARGAILSKDMLMARVWPDRIVEENNLQVHISDLRSILGADRDLIRTVFGRGYQFTGDLRTEVVAAQPALAPPRTNLPEAVSELIGRDDEIDEILSLAAAHRLVT